MAQILLTQGQVALVDDADYQWLTEAGKWHVTRKRGTDFYAAMRTSRITGTGKQVYMARLILGTTDRWTYVDHINGITLDNRRANLRETSNKDNVRNQKLHKDNKSGYKGVNRRRQGKYWYWRAFISQTHLGYFPSALAAAQAYDQAAICLHGEYASTNFHYTQETSESIQ